MKASDTGPSHRTYIRPDNMGSFAGNDIDCVVAERGGVIENYHRIHAAVVDAATGDLLYAVGNPQHQIHIRSAAKPAQAVAILEACGDHATAVLDEADVALICASHNSEPRHIDRVRAMQRKLGVKEGDLRCGGHPSISLAVNRAWIKQDLTPTAVHNNCSGKHTGMLAGAQALGGGIQGYHLADHPMQARVRSVVEELSGAPRPECITWGIDGCNLPAPAMAMELAARIYGRVADAADDEEVGREQDGKVDSRTKHLARIYHAMTRHPEMVAGEGRFCTQLMQAFEGILVGKVGAEACYGIGVRASERTRALGAQGAIGIMVKVEDGNMDVLHSAVMEVLDQLKIGSTEQRGRLAWLHHPPRLNTMDVVVGAVQPRFCVRKV